MWPRGLQSSGIRRQDVCVEMDTDSLIKAVAEDDVKMLGALVNAGSDINCTDYSGTTLLALASNGGKSKTAEYLRGNGATERKT
jgi:hypothetical protein